jgi:SAM-dependent methyltransferase
MHKLLSSLQNHLPFMPYAYKGTEEPCNLCGSTQSRLVCETDRRLKQLRTIACEICGLIRTDPMPSEAELCDYYAHSYRLDYQFALSNAPPRFHLIRSEREARGRIALLAPLLKPESRVLDVGAGSGEFLAHVASIGHIPHGLEPGRQFADFARQHHGLRVDAHGWQEAAFPDGSFDLITANHVLEHLREPVSAMQRMARWLADDGLIYIAVPNAFGKRGHAFQTFHFAHVYNFTPETLVWAGMAAGLEPDPRVPPTDTTIVFRKSRRRPAPAPWRVPRGADVAARFPSSSPVAYLLSGRWCVEAALRLRKVIIDSRRKSIKA